MARIGKGILSGFRGSVGTITGARVFEKDTIRKKRSKPNPTKSVSQAKTREDFKTALFLFKNVHPGKLKVIWEGLSKTRTAQASFLSKNLPLNIAKITDFQTTLWNSLTVSGIVLTFSIINLPGPRVCRISKSLTPPTPEPPSHAKIFGFLWIPARNIFRSFDQSGIAEWGSFTDITIVENFLSGEEVYTFGGVFDDINNIAWPLFSSWRVIL